MGLSEVVNAKANEVLKRLDEPVRQYDGAEWTKGKGGMQNSNTNRTNRNWHRYK